VSRSALIPTIERLIDRSDLTIYVNDNFGHWHSNRDDLVTRTSPTRRSA
jgi:hypothetical protein